MTHARVDDFPRQDSSSSVSALSTGIFTHWQGSERDRVVAGNAAIEPFARPRRTPRKSLIVVLGDNDVVSADLVTKRMLSDRDHEEMDVIVACAGPPRNLGSLQQRVRDLQVLLAPAGTSTEDLRELAMNRAPGDIVTLVSGSPAGRENG